MDNAEGQMLRELENCSVPQATEEDESRANELGEAIRKFLYAHSQTLADRTFDRIESRVAELVDTAAKRVVPANIRALIEQTVNVRVARLDDRIASARFEVANLEQRLIAEIARVESAEFVEPAKPRPKRKARAMKASKPRTKKNRRT